MKKIVKRLFLIILLLLIAYYIYRVAILMYAYKIDKKIMEHFEGDYAITINFSNERKMKNWRGEKYAKTSFYINQPEENSTVGETVDTWVDFENKISISEAEGKRLNVTCAATDDDYFIFTPFNVEGEFLTAGIMHNIKYCWTNLKDCGIITAISSTIGVPILAVDSIKTEVLDGKEYYVAESKMMQLKKYVDKETYLPYKMVNTMESGTSTTYEFSFEPITKENLEFPNFDDYYVEMN